MTERGAGAGSTGRAPRISPLRGLAGQPSGVTVALALAARKARPAERTDEAELYARRLGRCAPVALRAAELLWSELVGTSMPAATAAALGRRLTGFDEQPQVMSTGLTIRTLRTAMGRSPAEAYAAFDPEPFGVGPTSQVHSAMLHDGRWAAVKIRYHGVSQAVRGALAAPELQQALEPIVRAAAGPDAAARIHSVAGELRGRVEQSLSLRAEAAVQAQFAAHYRKHPFIRVPDAIAESSTERVLTMELAGGRGWADAMLGGSVERNRWAEALYRFARAPETALDPRSGNLLFHDDGAVSVLGFRTVRRLSPEQVNALARRDAGRRPARRGRAARAARRVLRLRRSRRRPRAAARLAQPDPRTAGRPGNAHLHRRMGRRRSRGRATREPALRRRTSGLEDA